MRVGTQGRRLESPDWRPRLSFNRNHAGTSPLIEVGRDLRKEAAGWGRWGLSMVPLAALFIIQRHSNHTVSPSLNEVGRTGSASTTPPQPTSLTRVPNFRAAP